MLAVEVTESAILTDPAAAAVHLAELAEMGVQVALDDFGTGFSSLSHLLALPLHIIKVDRSFVAGIVDDVRAREVVRAIISMSENLGVRVVAEGVETEAQADMLRSLGCPLAQGYLFGRPMPLADWPS
jgi:EAL domain-containing protein (putative c-di-GMP-specific phosphodiesterase class I)